MPIEVRGPLVNAPPMPACDDRKDRRPVAVRPLQRAVMISAEPGNESHATKLVTAVRRSMENRDPMAAAREIRELGSPVGFETVVIGV